jgi:hypothetical protein
MSVTVEPASIAPTAHNCATDVAKCTEVVYSTAHGARDIDHLHVHHLLATFASVDFPVAIDVVLSTVSLSSVRCVMTGAVLPVTSTTWMKEFVEVHESSG